MDQFYVHCLCLFVRFLVRELGGREVVRVACVLRGVESEGGSEGGRQGQRRVVSRAAVACRGERRRTRTHAVPCAGRIDILRRLAGTAERGGASFARDERNVARFFSSFLLPRFFSLSLSLERVGERHWAKGFFVGKKRERSLGREGGGSPSHLSKKEDKKKRRQKRRTV